MLALFSKGSQLNENETMISVLFIYLFIKFSLILSQSYSYNMKSEFDSVST